VDGVSRYHNFKVEKGKGKVILYNNNNDFILTIMKKAFVTRSYELF